jgi:hypothetical protein
MAQVAEIGLRPAGAGEKKRENARQVLACHWDSIFPERSFASANQGRMNAEADFSLSPEGQKEEERRKRRGGKL